MMRFRAAQANDLIDKANNAPAGMERVELYRRAAILADRQGDTDAAYRARCALINSAYDADAPLDQLIAFAYCISVSDRSPDRFDPHDLMWMYKWIVDLLIDFTPVQLELVERMIDDMASRYALNGLGSAACDQLRLVLFIKTGQRDRLEQAYDAWESNRERAGSDCLACQLHAQIMYEIVRGEDELAVNRAEPLIAGTSRCADVPHETFGSLHLPLLRLRRYEEAASLFDRGYDMIRSRQGFVRTVGEHAAFLAIAGQTEKGFELLQTHLREAMASRADLLSITFWRGAWAVCERSILEGCGTVSLSLSPRFECFEADGVYDVAALGEHFAGLLGRLAQAFDERNGNTAQQDITAEIAQQLRERISIAISTSSS